jgi:hypothetical protein
VQSKTETGCWTKEIYEALQGFGNIVRIEIDPQRSGAWVTFQWVPVFFIYSDVH